MKTLHRDFAAFLAKLQTPTAGAYERRNDPTVEQLTEKLNQAIGATGNVGEQLRELRQRQERMETRLARPGALPADDKTAGDSDSELFNAETGERLLQLKAGDNFEAKMRQAGLIKDDEYRELRLSDFVRGVARQKTSDLARKALSVGTDSAGGFAVPTSLMPTIMQAFVAGSSLLQAGSRMVPVGSLGEGAKTYNIAVVNAIPTAAWRSEAGNVSESDPSFRLVTATPRSLSFFFKVSRELLADAANLERALPVVIGQAMAKELDRAGLMGTGTAPEPRGIKNTVGIQPVANGANGASLATLRWANLMSAVQAILQADGPMPSAAIMAPRSLIGFGNLADTTNQPLRRPDTLEQMRFLATSQIPVNITTGTSTDTTDIYVGNFDRTSYFMRENVSIQLLDQVFATSGQVGFMAHVRADFVCEYPATLALISGVRP